MKTFLILLLASLFILATSLHIREDELLSATPGGMLYPQDSETREVKDLSGIWDFKMDDQNIGLDQKWYAQPLPQPTIPMPVPASYNDITQDITFQKHIGWVWYQTYFRVPKGWQNGNRVVLRLESAHYYTMVWINGQFVMEHNGGHLPFEAEISKFYNGSSANLLIVAVNNTLTPSTLPPGEITIYDGSDHMHPKGYTVQQTWFDFYNYAGIHRPVKLYSTPSTYIDDVTLNYQIDNDGNGLIHYEIVINPQVPDTFLVVLYDANGDTVTSSTDASSTLVVPSTSLVLWEPGKPYLYTLEIRSGKPDTDEYDVYRLSNVGIRTIQVTSTQFLINGKPFYFHGVDKHEDFYIKGKGLDNSIVIKDFNLMDWLGANAFRTSHYPYAEEYYYEADRRGIVIIAECPAVGMNQAVFFNNDTLQHHYDVMYEMIRRDKNHPSVVMWNVANEPASNLQVSQDYFSMLANYTRSIDPTSRPITLVNDQDFTDDLAAGFFDVVCINRYYGWYSDSGEIELIQMQLEYDLQGWYSKVGKPIIVSEYGADTVQGLHSDPSVMFTEDFQVDFMHQYHSVFDQYMSKYLIGELIWCFSDFKTGQTIIRVAEQNRKGVFTRDRNPKSGAHFLRDRYHKLGVVS